MRLFSVFDPVSFLGISLNWLILLVLGVFLPSLFFYERRRGAALLWEVGCFLKNIYREVRYPNFRGLLLVGFVVFMRLVILNTIGLFPYVFTSTGHLIVTLSLGVIFWIIGILIGWVKVFRVRSAHLVPEGSPLFLAPFIVLIERVSQLIRPVTLSVRLSANMMAGHLIIGLISLIREISLGVFWLSVILQRLILVLE